MGIKREEEALNKKNGVLDISFGKLMGQCTKSCKDFSGTSQTTHRCHTNSITLNINTVPESNSTVPTG